jgi:hypothetical protein
MNPSVLLGRPAASEYAPYYDRYISLVPGDDIVVALEQQLSTTMALLSGKSEADGDFRYAPDKWKVKEVLGHMSDTERIFAYRALRIARNDGTPMEWYEQDDYVRSGPFARVRLLELVNEFRDVRHATLSLLRLLDGEAWARRGIANKNEVSVRALAYTIAGHELHHRRILEERYFNRR